MSAGCRYRDCPPDLCRGYDTYRLAKSGYRISIVEETVYTADPATICRLGRARRIIMHDGAAVDQVAARQTRTTMGHGDDGQDPAERPHAVLARPTALLLDFVDAPDLSPRST